jgi:hypothetical protein
MVGKRIAMIEGRTRRFKPAFCAVNVHQTRENRGEHRVKGPSLDLE